MTSSSSVRARPAVCWPHGCRRTRPRGCSCSRPAAGSRWPRWPNLGPGPPSPAPRWTGATTPSSWTASAGPRRCHAAGGSAAHRRSTRWPSCGAVAPAMTRGSRPVRRAGIRRPAALLQAHRARRGPRSRRARPRTAPSVPGCPPRPIRSPWPRWMRPATLGHPIAQDVNSGLEEGFGWHRVHHCRRQATERRRRLPPSRSLDRPNLDLVTDALVHRPSCSAATAAPGSSTAPAATRSPCRAGARSS